MNLKILSEVCSLPTAPFVEGRVAEYVRQFAKKRRLRVAADETGNLLIELPGERKSPRWVFTAHMDHPGFVAEKMLDGKTLQSAFRGWVFADLMRGRKARFYDAEGEVVGTVLETTKDANSPKAVAATLRVPRPVAPGSLGMFEQGLSRVKGKLFYSRAIDDLGGLAAALEMIDRLCRWRQRPACTVAVLLTRAEEFGFVGAIAAVKKPRLLRKSDYLIAIETSAMQPCAKQGDGCIVRLGDRLSTFNSSLSHFLVQQAQELAQRDKTFKFQRAVMPGGTCEATVYCLYGFRASSICVALGNYHNMNQEKKAIGPEYIHMEDWRNMVELFLAVARHGHEYRPGNKALKAEMEKRFRATRHLLG